MQQRTIASIATLQGTGLFTGKDAKMSFCPAPVNHGIVFVREDLPNGPRVPALISRVVKRPRHTVLKDDEVEIETVEHCLSALAGLGIDNIEIRLNGPEVPIMDGSSDAFTKALIEANIVEQDAPKRILEVTEPVVVRQGDAMVAITPLNHESQAITELLYELDYGDGPIGRQLYTQDLGHEGSSEDYAANVAPARTYSTHAEAEAARASGMFEHVDLDEALVIDDNGQPMGAQNFRFDNEPVRHKMLDLIGDLYLLGAPIRGRVVAYKSGHALNHMMVRQLLPKLRAQGMRDLAQNTTIADVKRLFRMMPHRYPMLLIDRVIEVQGTERAVGIKNVTINEPFFQGHYPNHPVMPGVLIVEAMAQLSGVLIGQSLENVGKLPLLLSLDRVKLRKAVTPGDQLIIEAESVKLRPRMAHMRCRAYVGEDIAAEAEVKFMLLEGEEK